MLAIEVRILDGGDFESGQVQGNRTGGILQKGLESLHEQPYSGGGVAAVGEASPGILGRQ
jgi:hypothetical protein